MPKNKSGLVLLVVISIVGAVLIIALGIGSYLHGFQFLLNCRYDLFCQPKPVLTSAPTPSAGINFQAKFFQMDADGIYLPQNSRAVIEVIDADRYLDFYVIEMYRDQGDYAVFNVTLMNDWQEVGHRWKTIGEDLKPIKGIHGDVILELGWEKTEAGFTTVQFKPPSGTGKRVFYTLTAK